MSFTAKFGKVMNRQCIVWCCRIWVASFVSSSSSFINRSEAVVVKVEVLRESWTKDSKVRRREKGNVKLCYKQSEHLFFSIFCQHLCVCIYIYVYVCIYVYSDLIWSDHQQQRAVMCVLSIGDWRGQGFGDQLAASWLYLWLWICIVFVYQCMHYPIDLSPPLIPNCSKKVLTNSGFWVFFLKDFVHILFIMLNSKL